MKERVDLPEDDDFEIDQTEEQVDTSENVETPTKKSRPTSQQSMAVSAIYDSFGKLILLAIFGVLTILVVMASIVFFAVGNIVAATWMAILSILFGIGLLFMVDHTFPSTLPQYMSGILDAIRKFIPVLKD